MVPAPVCICKRFSFICETENRCWGLVSTVSSSSIVHDTIIQAHQQLFIICSTGESNFFMETIYSN